MFYILQKITFTKCAYFFGPITTQHFRTLQGMAVLIQLQKLAWPPCWYYWC